MNDPHETLKKCIELMRQDVAEFEAKYLGRFAEMPHIGFGNRKTRCVNEATLPIITCHPSCLEKCAGTCYVLAICTKFRPNCRKCEAKNTVLRRIDPNAYYEHFYSEAERLNLPVRLSDGGDFENEAQVAACVAAARRHPTVHAILYTKRRELLVALVDRPATLHARYSSWQGDDEGESYARSLGFSVTHVVWDGSGNCPYQHSFAKFNLRKRELTTAFCTKGVAVKEAKKRAEKQAEREVHVWHCRDCATHGYGCCGAGDIRFNVVGGADWAERAESRRESIAARM